MSTQQQMQAMLDLSPLDNTMSPWLHLLVGVHPAVDQLAWVLGEQHKVARILRGRKMQTTERMFDEFAAAFQFGSYFGESWPAFDECLADLDWLPGQGYVPIIMDARYLLALENLDQLRILIKVWYAAAETFAEPMALGENWDRPALPFHVVLQEEAGNVATVQQRFAQVGVSLHLLNRNVGDQRPE